MDKGRKIMSERLYYGDVRMAEFDAVVTGCVKNGDIYEITLDRTCFYPEGGGQPADHGFINGARVLDVHEKNGEVVHYCDTPLETGT